VDAVVVGGGLAGLSAALTLLDRGGRVVLLEKEAFVGGNTLWASSGINGVDAAAEANPDSVGAYANDTLVSGGQTTNPLVQALAEGSVSTLEWLRSRVHVSLDKVSQLGGHSHARTHRPSSGLAGSELVNALKRAVGEYERSGRLTVLKKTRATRLLLDQGQVNPSRAALSTT
jgi:succinate dehydrogenase/fumarate reductase flavoprotein subunit